MFNSGRDTVRFSRSDLVDLIFSTLHFDSGRGGHTVETLIIQFRVMGIIDPYTQEPRFTPLQVRLIVAGLLQAGQLDMRSNGYLTIPESSPDPAIEKYRGAWYLTTTNGRVQGPYSSEMEAQSANTIHSDRV